MFNNMAKRIMTALMSILLTCCSLPVYGFADDGEQPDFSDANVGDIIEFGHYEQDNIPSNGQEAVKWIVVDKNDNMLLLLSQSILDAKPYHQLNTGVNWPDCSLRGWMNSTLLDALFTEQEKSYVCLSHIKNEDEETEDRIFLLSKDEVEKYTTVKERKCIGTKYARLSCGLDYDQNTYCSPWLLRTIGNNGNPMNVQTNGLIYQEGTTNIDRSDRGIRPAVWVSVIQADNSSGNPSADMQTDVPLTSQEILSSTNNTNSDDGVVIGNWTDIDGILHTDALKFWVFHGYGYSDSESITYPLTPEDETVYGTITASKDCGTNAKMWVNIYLDDQLVYESNIVTAKAGEIPFSIDVSDASSITVECETSSHSPGCCIVDAKVSNNASQQNVISNDHYVSVRLTTQKLVSSTNEAGAQTDVVVGNWTDTEGNLHRDSLKFWVIHADGYSDTESIKYQLSSEYGTLKGTITASENCAKGAEMWVNIYLDDQRVYESSTVTRKSGEESFLIDVSDASVVKIECKASTADSGYCIVDASLGA